MLGFINLKIFYLIMKTQTVILIGILIFAGVILYLGSQYFNQGSVSTIQSQGTSELTVAPDLSRITIGVSILKNDSKSAQAEENKAISDIIESLKQIGISSSDIETENINLYEEKQWDKDGGEKSLGWRATQNLKIKTANFSKLGDIVDVSVNNGANQINSIEFYLSSAKQQEYKRKAIEEATKDARLKAESMAEGSSGKLGRIKSLTQNDYYATPYYYSMKNNAGVAAARESATVMPEDVKVTANINVVYELK